MKSGMKNGLLLGLCAASLIGCANKSQSQSQNAAPYYNLGATPNLAAPSTAAAAPAPAAAAAPNAGAYAPQAAAPQNPAPTVQGQVLQPGQKLDPAALQWPRYFETNNYEYAVYQPQISAWPSNQIQGRFATAVRPAGTSNEVYGVIYFTARTEIDKVNRLVTLEDFKVTKTDFPTEPAFQDQYVAVMQAELPKAAKTIPLDHLEAVFALSGEIADAKMEQVKNDPPRVIYTTQPSLLISVEGAPVLKPLVGNYLRVINTQAILLENTNSVYQGYYLYAASNWYSAPSIEGPWVVTQNPPSDIGPALQASLATKVVDPMYPKAPLTAPLTVYVSTTPAELIQTSGAANMLSISGTDLLYVPNTDSALFYYMTDANYYVLISGRWFKSLSLYGPWNYVPAAQLPADFTKIPPSNPKGNVLASIPGTPMAREAVIANSIPQTATIEREKAKLDVVYYGGPSFVPIEGTTLMYAANTQTPVIQVTPTSFYACQGGVWFVSPSATGPWAVALSVPSAIYTIPVSCPIHYVTYSYVYGSTPTYVYVGYTPGYMGTVVASDGVVVCGTGYYYPPVIVGATYVSYPPTYGYGWGMAVGAAAGFAFGYCAGVSSACWCEPHWGCYGWAYSSSYSYVHVNCNGVNYYSHWGGAVYATGCHGYNPYTGTSWASSHATTFNPYNGAVSSVNRAGGYNPYTGNYAGGSHGNYYNPSTGARAAGSKGVEGNAYTGNYAAGKQGAAYNPSTGRYAAGQKGTVGNAYTGNSASVDRGIAGNANTGNKVAWNNGNVYTDHDGNIHHYDDSTGSWSQYGKNGWGDSYKPTTSSWSDRGWDSSSWNNADRATSMDRESWGQSLGSSRFDSWRGSGGGGWGGFHGGGGFGRR
jgi:hypothetical protein